MGQTDAMTRLGYTRVSTAAQDPQLQINALIEDGVLAADIYSDVTSGGKVALDRPGIRGLLARAEPGDTIIVWRIDRLGRSLIDMLNTVQLFKDRELQLRSISDGIDPATSTGRLLLNMFSTLAEYERELITERVNAGIEAARQSGTRFGRPVSDPSITATKLALVAEARGMGRTAAEAASMVGWSRATLYRHQQRASALTSG